MHGLSRFLSGHLSIAHAPPSISHPYSPLTISHPYSPLTISRGSLYHKHTLSPSPCIHVLNVSLLTFVPCWPYLYWTCAIGVSLPVANNHTLAIFVCLLASLFYLGYACELERPPPHTKIEREMERKGERPTTFVCRMGATDVKIVGERECFFVS